jgi:hypothetical protein
VKLLRAYLTEAACTWRVVIAAIRHDTAAQEAEIAAAATRAYNWELERLAREPQKD